MRFLRIVQEADNVDNVCHVCALSVNWASNTNLNVVLEMFVKYTLKDVFV